MIKLDFKKEEVNIENRDEAGILQVTSTTSLGKVYDECDIDIYGDDMEIGFNKYYLSDALKAVKEEKVLLNLESSTKSLIISPYDDETKNINMDIHGSKFLYMVLPIRLKNA